jgi:hypothetical protein
MGKGTGKAPPRKRRRNGALANKRAADLHARIVAPTIRRLRAAEIVSHRDLADELRAREAGWRRAREAGWVGFDLADDVESESDA